MIGWGIGTAMFQLLAGLVVQNAAPLADSLLETGNWTDRDHQSYFATFAFRYALSVFLERRLDELDIHALCSSLGTWHRSPFQCISLDHSISGPISSKLCSFPSYV